MGKIKLSVLAIVSLGMLFWLGVRFSSPSIPTAVRTVTPSPPKTIRYIERNLPQAIAHILWIPANHQFLVTPALSTTANTVEEFAKKHRMKRVAGFGGRV